MKDHYLVPEDTYVPATLTDPTRNCNVNLQYVLQLKFDNANSFVWFDNLDYAIEYEQSLEKNTKTSSGQYKYHTPIYKMQLPEETVIHASAHEEKGVSISIVKKTNIISTLSVSIYPYNISYDIKHKNQNNMSSMIMTLLALRSQDVAFNHAIDNFIDTIQISKCEQKIKNKMLSQTIQYLQEDLSPEKYKALADTWSGHSNKNVAALGLLMVGIAAILLALSPVAVPITIGLGLAGLGIFAAANQEKGMAKAGRDILNSAARI